MVKMQWAGKGLPLNWNGLLPGKIHPFGLKHRNSAGIQPHSDNPSDMPNGKIPTGFTDACLMVELFGKSTHQSKKNLTYVKK